MSELVRVTVQPGIELEVWDSGPRDAPALIFLHGFPENHRTWRYQVEHLNDRYRCIAPDLRGYGNSSRPTGVEHYGIGDLMGDVYGLAAELGVPEFTIIGHDWGGALAWGIAAHGQSPGKVRRAIIANAPHPVTFAKLLQTDPGQRAASQYMNTFRDPQYDDLIREHGLAPLLQKAIEWENPVANEPAEAARQFEEWSDPDRSFAMLNWYRASAVQVPMPDEPYGLAPDRIPPFRNIAIPTLVMWGMKDEALLPINLDTFGDVVSDLTIMRIKDGGHFIPWETPKEVNAAMDEFLAATD